MINTDQSPVLDEIAQGQGLSLTQAARLFPSARRGRPVTLSCVLRWVLGGVRAAEGGRIRLEAARLSGRWLTTAAAIRRFLAAQTPRLDDSPPPAPRTPRQRPRRSERAA